MEFDCSICPRACGARRGDDLPGGLCRSPALPSIARAAAHFGEEPCIGGLRGAGAVFFTGCNLGCVFCQNQEINRGQGGRSVSVAELRDIFRRLEDEGVQCLDLVTGSQYIPPIAEALGGMTLSIPVVWNSSGYESVESLKLLEGLVHVYMPDFKYWDSSLALRYSRAADYPEVARAAIHEMYRQTGSYVMGEAGALLSGLLIRHLILPGQSENAMNVIDFVADEFPAGSILFSLMSQYTPMPGLKDFPELSARVSRDENEGLIHYMKVRSLEDGYWQDTEAAGIELIPEFDLTGVSRRS